jgi:hypothetical protein
MTKYKKSCISRRLLSAGNAVLLAGLTTTLLATHVCFAQTGGAGKPHGSDYVQNLTQTATHNEQWEDLENQLAVSGSSVHVAWRAYTVGSNNITTNRIYYARSLDHGATFGPWVLLEERTESGYIQGSQWLAVDGLDVHLITLAEGYADASGNHGQRLQYHRSTDGGATFEPPVLLGSTLVDESFGGALLGANAGRVSVAVTFLKQSHNPLIKFLRSADRGTNFAVTVLPPLAPGLVQLTQSGSQVCLLWQDIYSSGFWGDGAAQVACSTDGGTNFTVNSLETPPVPLVGNLHADSPRLALAGTNVITVFIFENTNTTPTHAELHLRRSTDAGVTFGPPVNLTQSLDPDVDLPGDGQYDVAIDGTNVCVVFATQVNDLYRIRSTDGGASFLPPVLVADRWFNQSIAMQPMQPRLAQDPAARSRMHLLWGGMWHRTTADGGATWSPPANLMLQYSGWLLQPTPQVTVDNQGALHWNASGSLQDPDYYDQDVLYRRFSLGALPPATQNFGAQFGQLHEDRVRFDNLQIPAGAALQLSNAFAVECWVRLSANTNYPYPEFVVKTLSAVMTSYDIFRLYVNGDNPSNRWFAATMYFGGAGDYTAQNSAFRLQSDRWYHLAATFDATADTNNLKLYVNGELQGSANVTGSLPTSPVPWVVSRFLDGAVDDLRFWNRALTAQEIRDRFTGPLAGNEPGLAAYYTFDDTWAESTGNGLPAVPMYRESFGAGADTQPVLQIENVSGNQVKLSWLTFGASYALKFSATLANPDWQPVPGTPQMINGRWTLTTDATSNPRFFRLQSGN